MVPVSLIRDASRRFLLRTGRVNVARSTRSARVVLKSGRESSTSDGRLIGPIPWEISKCTISTRPNLWLRSHFAHSHQPAKDTQSTC
ncbi:unnamed protein product [Protopolystoma xenopodis]|uniref:Uncharacterized protein n=1 Tax=Protopolystoma xenopodis TaxID=117903 RepID=A0A3S5CLN7_9PLAT|nr:unnamed protein product [Protopolystoma xenopodis]